MIVPCGHRCLCRNCGDNVMSTKPECPLCRSSIKGFNQLPSKAEAKIAAEKAAAEKAAAEKAAADAKVVILATLDMSVCVYSDTPGNGKRDDGNANDEN
jgi:hypothetical protein